MRLTSNALAARLAVDAGPVGPIVANELLGMKLVGKHLGLFPTFLGGIEYRADFS